MVEWKNGKIPTLVSASERYNGEKLKAVKKTVKYVENGKSGNGAVKMVKQAGATEQ